MTFIRWLSLLFLSFGIAIAQQQTISVSNAASSTNPGNVAAGSLIAIQLGLPPSGPLPQPIPQIDPSTVSVNLQPNGAASPMKLTVFSVSGPLGPVIALLPANIALGTARLTLSYNGLTSAPAHISIVPTNFGLFMIGRGFGPALAQQIGGNRVLLLNQLTHPAKPDDYVILWGTGLGSATQKQVTVMLGGKAVRVSYAGPAPGEPGLDQINFVVPGDPSVPNDCYVALWVEAAGTRSNSSSISKTSDGSACQSSLGLTAADLATLDSGGTVALAQLNLSARIAPPQNARQTPGAFERVESADFMTIDMAAQNLALISGAVVSDDAFFGCSVQAGGLAVVRLFVVIPGAIDFGNQAILTGPTASLDLTSSGLGFSGAQTSPTVAAPNLLPAPLFAPGTWIFSGSGGSSSSGSAVALPFSQQLVLPPEIMAANFNALQTVDRQQDQTVAWNPVGFGENDVVTVTLAGNTNQAAPPGRTTITCNARAAAGQIKISASLLQNLAASMPAPVGGSTLNLLAAPKPGHVQTFALPLSRGSSLPVVFRFYSSEVWPLAIQ